VTETDRPHSGSRWEPGALPPSADTTEPVIAETAAPRRRLPARLRKRAALAGAAVSLVAIGGLGGFALEHEIGRNGTIPTGVVHGGTPDGGGQSDPGQDGSGQDSGPDGDDGGSGRDTGDDA
jgi:hypothetical protein